MKYPALFLSLYSSLVLFGQDAFALPCGTVENKIDKNTDNTQTESTVITDSQGNHRLWRTEQQKELTYCVSDRFKELKPKMVRSLEVATQEWTDGTSLRFKYIPEADKNCDKKRSTETLFKISINTSRRYPYAARAFFPYDERNIVTFKKTYVEKEFEELLRLTLHELGHVIGLRHEHIRHENPYREHCVEDDDFTDITDYDRDSIMHYARCGGTGAMQLSPLDKEGIKILYPL